ncbi:hypothetical protein D049_4478A, partial [Vibrio parahaemolyticus VPTS-2010]
MAPSAAPRRLI